MWSLNDVRRTQEPVSWSNRASSGGVAWAWWVVHTSAAPSLITQAGVVTASPMNASSRQRSSCRPSSQMRPQAFPVPSVLAYQIESSSHHDASPTDCRSGQGSEVSPVARSITMMLPASSPWSLAYPSTISARVPSGERSNPSICHSGS